MNIIIKKINGGNDEYLLTENDKTILKVRHRRDLHTARIETANGQRILIIENEGLIKTRVAVKNEYGVEIGQMTFDNWSDKQGVIQIENIRYKFLIKNIASPELLIYKNTLKEIVYQCKLSFEPNSLSSLKDQLSALIVSIAWLLHLKKVDIIETALA